MITGRISPSTMLMPVWVITALVGVWFLGCTLSSQDGSALARAMPYRNLVEAFVHAMETAMAELNSAISTMIQAPPQYRWPRTNGREQGRAGERGQLGGAPAGRLAPRDQ